MLLNPNAVNSVRFKLDVEGVDSIPMCRLIIHIGMGSLLLHGVVDEGGVWFEIPVLKGLLIKGTRSISSCVLEAIVEEQYFVLNIFDIDFKEDIKIAADTVAEVPVVKPRLSVDVSDVVTTSLEAPNTPFMNMNSLFQ